MNTNNIKPTPQKRIISRVKTEGDFIEQTHKKGNKYEQLQQIRKKYNRENYNQTQIPTKT